MKQIAVEYNVTIVGVTETIQPPDVPFQVWMNGELRSCRTRSMRMRWGNEDEYEDKR